MELNLDQIMHASSTRYKIFRTRTTPNGLMSARPYEEFRPTLFGLVESQATYSLFRCTHEGCESVIKTHTIDRFPRTLGNHGYQNGALADIQLCEAGHVEKVRI